jgi:hypothetical protein
MITSAIMNAQNTRAITANKPPQLKAKVSLTIFGSSPYVVKFASFFVTLIL